MLLDRIFKNNTDLKKESRNMVNDLPLLNHCGYREELKGKHCLTFSVNCGMCIRERCKNCFTFNKWKDILIVAINKFLIRFEIFYLIILIQVI